MPKRKRTSSAPKKGTKKRKYVAGVSRVGGYYGRYSSFKPEMKFHDVEYTLQLDTTAEVLPGGGTSTGMNLVAQGVTEKTRVGRKMIVKSIHLKGWVNYPSNAAGGSPGLVKIALVWDKQANGAYPSWADVYEIDEPYSPRNLANSQRFVILKEFYFSLSSTAGSGNGTTDKFSGQSKIIKYFKKCNIPIEFDSTTGAITEVKSNNLLLIADAKGQDDTIIGHLHSRIRFTD